jgi:hypothetical protein
MSNKHRPHLKAFPENLVAVKPRDSRPVALRTRELIEGKANG